VTLGRIKEKIGKWRIRLKLNNNNISSSYGYTECICDSKELATNDAEIAKWLLSHPVSGISVTLYERWRSRMQNRQ